MGRVREVRHFLALSLVLLFAASASAKVCASSEVPKASITEYDPQTTLFHAGHDTALQTHLPVQPSTDSAGKRRTNVPDA